MNKEQIRERLEAIKERCEKATEGKWGLNRYTGFGVEQVGTTRSVASTGGYSTNMDDGVHVIENYANADFIANSRSDIPYLVSVIESLMEEVSDG